MIVQVNDKLCCDANIGVYFSSVKAITPAGWIKLENGSLLNPDLSIRGAGQYGPFRYRVPTSDDFKKYRRRVNATELDRASRMVREYTDEQLQKIADCIREVTAGGSE